MSAPAPRLSASAIMPSRPVPVFGGARGASGPGKDFPGKEFR